MVIGTCTTGMARAGQAVGATPRAYTGSSSTPGSVWWDRVDMVTLFREEEQTSAL
jgi:hypothetical protein